MTEVDFEITSQRARKKYPKPRQSTVLSPQHNAWWERCGKVDEHNGWVPRDFWLENWERRAIPNS